MIQPEISERDAWANMVRTLIGNWWLLALCGIAEAVYAAANLFMQDATGSLTWRTNALKGTVLVLGKLALAAGGCAIAAGLWRSAAASPGCWRSTVWH